MYYRLDKDGIRLYVKVKPNSASDKILDIEEVTAANQACKFYLVVQICAVKHEGQANKRLLAFLAKQLKIPKSKITILTGTKANYKLIKLLADPIALKDRMGLLGI